MDDSSVLLDDTDETALIQVIRYLNPMIIVDESHHATSDLSVEMLQNFNPSFVFDLTATPKKKSNTSEDEINQADNTALSQCATK